MGQEMIKKYNRTNIFIIEDNLWAWAQYRSKTLGYDSASEYLFDLIRIDKDRDLMKNKAQ